MANNAKCSVNDVLDEYHEKLTDAVKFLNYATELEKIADDICNNFKDYSLHDKADKLKKIATDINNKANSLQKDAATLREKSKQIIKINNA